MIFTYEKTDELYHHGVKGQRWGIKNGPPYPLDAKALSNQLYDLAKRKEPIITRDVTSAIKSSGSLMYGLEHRLKTKDSIERKIETDSKNKSITLFEAAKSIHDCVRYTSISSDDSFTGNYFSVKNKLDSLGYKEIRCKNYFDLYEKGIVKHKSVQSQFKDSSGYIFEIQFQTNSSQKVKDLKIPLYEEVRSLSVTKERRAQIEREMEKMAEEIPQPKNVNTIKTYG